MFEIEQYRAIREAAGLVDRSARGTIAVTGRDRASYLQGLLTNDIVALVPGAGCYAASLTPQGRMIADMQVLELGDRMLLNVSLAVKDRLVERLAQLVFSEDVQISDATDALAIWSVHGPGAVQAVESVVDAPETPGAGTSPGVLAGLGECQNISARLGGEPGGAARAPGTLANLAEHASVRATLRGQPVIVVRSGDLGEPGFDLYVDRQRGPALREALCAAGAVDVNVEVAEVLRVEAGRAAFGVDMDEDTIPLEAGIEDRAISQTKGCYVGQEVIVRILHRGHGRVARRLVGLAIDASGGVPARGEALWSGDDQVGRITSAVYSPRLGRPIALGYVRRDLAAPGTRLELAQGGRRTEAVVTSLPFAKLRN